MIVSPVAMRLLRWQTPPDAEMRITDMDWALLRWVRYGASIHLARVIAGTWLRGTPLWTSHLRFNGARLGRRVYVNSLSVSDYNLIECGDDVVIGGAVHLSGHTVEAGVVKTARVRLGDRVTIGLGSVIEIGVEIGSSSQVGALSFVPKFAKLKGGVSTRALPRCPWNKERLRMLSSIEACRPFERSGRDARRMAGAILRHPSGLTKSRGDLRVPPEGARRGVEMFHRRLGQVPVWQDADVVRRTTAGFDRAGQGVGTAVKHPAQDAGGFRFE